MTSLRSFALAIGVVVAISAPALPQTQIPFTLALSQDQQTSTIGDGATVTLAAAAVGQAATATLSATYRGSTQVTVARLELTGPSDFSVASVPSAPAVLRSGEAIAITIRYRPATAARASGRLVLALDEGGKTGTITLNLSGTAPDFVFSYVQLPAGNATALAPGDVLRFPDTAARSSATVAVTISNRGSGTGVLNAVTVRGAAFQLSGLPLLPAALESGRELRVNVVFSPSVNGDQAGGLTVDVSGRVVEFSLAGKAVGPAYTYELLLAEGARAVAPDGEIALPDVPVGQHGKVAIRVRNGGNAQGTVSVISVAGAGFTLADLPFLPVAIAPGAAVAFTIDFDATQPGRFTGRLRIGDDTFQLAALALGSTLQVSYDNGSGAIGVANNGNIFLPTVAVGSAATARVSLRNTGTTTATISIIAVAGAGFSLLDLPDLPLAIKPDQSIGFGISAVPSSVALVTGSLRIDQMTFNLSLAGQPPPPLPAYRFTMENGSAEPMQQVAVGLSLGAPYRLPIKGTLTLSFVSDAFAADPAVQFASGGRTVSFEIPADTTTAIFPGNSNQVRFQTGTVAGAINLAPAFSYESSTLTPEGGAPLVLQVAPSVPQILSAQVASKSAAGLTLVISGFSTGRSVQQLEFEFIPLTTLGLPTMPFRLNSDSVFSSWYQSTQSQQFGSLFTVTVPFTGTVSNGGSLADVLQSVRIRASNQLGASGFYDLSLR